MTAQSRQRFFASNKGSFDIGLSSLCIDIPTITSGCTSRSEYSNSSPTLLPKFRARFRAAALAEGRTVIFIQHSSLGDEAAVSTTSSHIISQMALLSVGKKRYGTKKFMF
jgi:hypothetical protein